MSDLSPLTASKQTSRRKAATSGFDPGRVKTCARRECAELFSPLPPFDCAASAVLHSIPTNPATAPTLALSIDP